MFYHWQRAYCEPSSGDVGRPNSFCCVGAHDARGQAWLYRHTGRTRRWYSTEVRRRYLCSFLHASRDNRSAMSSYPFSLASASQSGCTRSSVRTRNTTACNHVAECTPAKNLLFAGLLGRKLVERRKPMLLPCELCIVIWHRHTFFIRIPSVLLMQSRPLEPIPSQGQRRTNYSTGNMTGTSMEYR